MSRNEKFCSTSLSVPTRISFIFTYLESKRNIFQDEWYTSKWIFFAQRYYNILKPVELPWMFKKIIVKTKLRTKIEKSKIIIKLHSQISFLNSMNAVAIKCQTHLKLFYRIKCNCNGFTTCCYFFLYQFPT